MTDIQTKDSQLSPLKRAFLALEEMQAKLDAVERARTEPIAVIGIGCRFPGDASTPQGFWDLLHNGMDAIAEVPADRWDVDDYYDSDPQGTGTMSTRYGAFLQQGMDQFDPQFFGIAPREAHGMDPQQRLLLEVCWEALEFAGQAPDALMGTQTGVFIGVCANDYAHLYLKSSNPALLDGYYTSGIAHSIVSGRLSYLLGLQGPSISIDTACSSSLTAVHLAVQSLRSGETDMALAGGVNLMLSPENYISFSKFGMLASDGRCKTFDAAADGFARGEGCGVIVLKRLSDALANGDTVLALIRGTAINQDGASSGLTAPNGPAQEAVIRAALAQGGIDPRLVSYIEAHGTGTSLGDPIEVQALGAVFGPNHTADRPLLIGSAKTNIGHLEAAAGIAGLLKVVLALRNKEIPPHLNFRTPSPFIPWARLPFHIPVQPTYWEGVDGRRIAGISSFGFSGTNVHVVLEEAPEPAPMPDSILQRPRHLLALSARNEPALKTLAAHLQDHLEVHRDQQLGDVCFSANAGRAHFDHRLAITANSSSEMREKLLAFASGQTAAGVVTNRVELADRPKVAFLFTGQGSQYVDMGRKLYETQPTFNAALTHCAELLRPYLDENLLRVLYPEPGFQSPLNDTAYAQPALFSIEYALAKLWQSWGVEPSFVMGHSVGEFVAATLAGVFSLEDGLKLVAARGRLMSSLPAGGAMATVFAAEERVRTAIAPYVDTVDVAAVNGPESVVISGLARDVQAILANLRNERIKARSLNVSHAFHSPLLDPILDEFERIASEITYSPPRIRLVSGVTGQVAPGARLAQASYWRQHARAAVQFAASIDTLQRQAVQIYLEIGPSPTLIGMGQSCLAEADGSARWLASLKARKDDWEQMLDSLAALYLKGVPIDWDGFDQDYARRRLNLPTYPFQRQRYWLPKQPAASQRQRVDRSDVVHPLLGHRLRSAMKAAQFEVSLTTEAFPFLDDHRISGDAVLPGAAFMEAALAAARVVLGSAPHAVQDMVFHDTLMVRDGEACVLQWIVTPQETGEASFECYRQVEGDQAWQLHASGRLVPGSNESPPAVAIQELQALCSETVTADAHYADLRSKGLNFGASLLGVAQIWRRTGEALGQIQLTESVTAEQGAYALHPALLDAHLQVLAAALSNHNALYLPFSLDRFQIFRPGVTPEWSYIRLQPGAEGAGEIVRGQVRMLDGEGHTVAEVEGLCLKRLSGQRSQPALPAYYHDWLYQVAWEPHPHPMAEAAPVRSTHSPVGAYHLSAMATHLDTHFDELEVQNGLDRYAVDLAPALDRLSLAYVLRAFRLLGWQPARGEHFTVDGLAQELGIMPRHRRLLRRLLEILQENHQVQMAGFHGEVSAPLDGEEPAGLYALLASKYPDHGAVLALVNRCGENLAEALRGKADPLQLLFPNSDLSTAEQLYRDSPSAWVYNGLARAAVEGMLAHWPDQEPLRVLEIGGGTGGTSSHLLPILPPEITSYLFTDISPLFVARAQEKFSQYPFACYQVLDIEKDPGAQDLADEQFDLIVAANVIHATADLRQSLAHVRQLLKPNGLLLLLEVTRAERWMDITFGLTDGWWRFTDTDLRPTYPLLTTGAWKDLLLARGFEEVTAVPGERGGRFADEALILAKNSAIVQAENGAHPTSGADHWLIFGDREGTGRQLAEQLAAHKHVRTTLVQAGEGYAVRGDNTYEVDPRRPEDFQHLLHEITGAHPLGGVVYLWGLDAHPVDNVPDSLEEAVERVSAGALHLIQALTMLSGQSTPRLWLVTRGAQAIGPGIAPMSVAQSPLWGLGKVAALEHPELHVVRVDLDPAGGPEEVQSLFHELWAEDGEDQIALRGRDRYISRLVHGNLKPGPGQPSPSNGQPVQLEVSERGTLDNLQLKPLVRRSPGAGEVEIRVHATGLNFKDVLMTLGMYPGEPSPLGGECAGEIVRLGPGVEGFQVGDRVVAVAAGAFRSYVIAQADLVAPLPDALSFVEAASLPIAFLTADFTLNHLARLQPGERVLIHAAAGGVGLAAVQLAQRVGAEVFATAGSPAKRAYLRTLGVSHVFDSRSLAFAEQIQAVTGGRGVDVVLNSLAGDFIPKSLAVLAPNGRFLEIGKTGLLTAEQAAALGEGRTYFIVDWSETARQEPALIQSIFTALMADVAAGRLTPLPRRVFPLQDVQAAFRYMAQARHIGKIVLTHEGTAGTLARADAIRLSADATYLVTGGLSGLGLLVAGWMVETGARHLVLMGRSGASASAREAIRAMEESGAQVLVVQADVSQPTDVRRVLVEIKESLPPLRGIIHSAGVLDDGALLHQNWERFEKVLAPKVRGAWYLHQMTQYQPLDFFVLFSSVASIFGSPGQANHAAANAFLDGLAYYRQAQGLPATSINWGAWSGVGIAANRNIDERRSEQGMKAIAPQDGLRLLEAIVQQGPAQIGVSPMSWQAFLHNFAGGSQPFFSAIARPLPAAVAGNGAAVAVGPDLPSQLAQVPRGKQRSVLASHIKAQAGKVLGLDPQAFGERTPLSELGLDSLMALELRNLLSENLGMKRSLPATLLFDYPTIEAISDYLMREVIAPPPVAEAPSASEVIRPSAASKTDDSLLETLEDLSDEEVDFLLAQKQLKNGSNNG